MPTPSSPPVNITQPVDLQLGFGVVVGELIADKYRVERLLGQGGMGIVVAAKQLNLDRRVAIKLIRDEWGHEPHAVARLVREAKAAARIQSEHIAHVLDVGTLENGAPFIVMEYLEGHDLDTLLRQGGPLAVSDAVDYLLQACEALAEAHRNGIVHRDLKPANVFIARQPGGVACVKVVDFGISKVIGGQPLAESLTHPSRVVGSLYHMAPEQMRGKPVDARTDIWALGVLLFEMLAGRKPFREGPWPDICAQVLNEPGPLIASIGGNVPPELEAIIQKCLSRAPGDRYANVAELAVALNPFGKASSRISLERIVRIATSTGSLAAEGWSPPVTTAPEGLAGREGPRHHTPFIAPSREESAITKEPVVSSVASGRPRGPLLVGAAFGLAVVLGSA